MSKATMIPLRDLGNWSGGNTPSKGNAAYWTDGTVPWVSPKDMKVDEIASSMDRITELALADGRVSLVPEGSVLFVTRSGILAHTFPIAITKMSVTINQDLKALAPKPGISPKYVAHAVRGASRRILKECSKHGTTVASIDTKALLDFEIPIVALDEQHRIVAEIEKQFSRLDEAVAGLKRVKANLKRYKAAVLKAAVEGRLVPTEADLARRENRSYETGTQLLQRILETRRSQWQGKGKYKEPAASPDTTDLPGLTEGWCWATVNQLVAHLTDGDHQPPPQTDSGIPFLVIGNVRRGVIDFTNTRFVGESYYASLDASRCPQLGDLLYTLVGSYGITVPVKTNQQFCIQRHMAIFRLHDQSPMEYLTVAMSSDLVFRQATAIATGTAQLTVPLAGLRNIAIPLPPLAEQHRIVTEVDGLLSIAREAETEVEANLKRAQALRQAILSKAFMTDHGMSQI